MVPTGIPRISGSRVALVRPNETCNELSDAEIVEGANPWWIGWGSMVLAGSGVIPTLTRTVPNARRLGSAQDSAEKQSALARAIYRDHRFSLARMSLVLGLQLIAR